MILKLLNSIKNSRKEIDVKILPSQGLFYKDDFTIKIKKASNKDIIEYENGYDNNDINKTINKIKKIIQKNIILSNNYKFTDIKGIDIIFLFLEIVKFTLNKSIKFNYFDNDKGYESIIEFSPSYFNYFKIDKKIINEYYDKETNQFIIDGFKYSLPSIGIEECLVNYLLDIENICTEEEIDQYNNLSYNFIYFLGNQNVITYPEIENLIQIFNGDIDDQDMQKIEKIIEMFKPLNKYALKKGDNIIEINSKIDLEKIWK